MRRILSTLVVLACLVASETALAQSVITPSPDPNHSILSQAFQDQADQGAGIALTEGNQLELLENGVRSFPRKLDLIRSATTSVFFTSMVIRHDNTGSQFARELIAAAQRGVEVRCIVDATLSSATFKRNLRQGGVHVLEFNPTFGDKAHRKGRLHQKIVVADYRRAIVGGMNMTDQYNLGDGQNDDYHDCDVLVAGDGAAAVSRRFLELWLELDPGNLAIIDALARLPQWGPAPTLTAGRVGYARYIAQASDRGEFRIRDHYRTCFDAARSQIVWHVNNIVPAGLLYEGLQNAASRGVRVVLMTNSMRACMRTYGIWGWFQYMFVRYWFRRSIAGTGIEVWETDVPLHSKALTIDGVMASVGSYNFSSVSDANFEGTIVSYDPAFVRAVEDMFERDLQKATRSQ